MLIELVQTYKLLASANSRVISYEFSASVMLIGLFQTVQWWNVRTVGFNNGHQSGAGILDDVGILLVDHQAVHDDLGALQRIYILNVSV